MAITNFDSWSTTAGSNIDIGGISILGTAPVSNFDGALRAMMAQLKAGVLSLSGGTINGVINFAYNGSANPGIAMYDGTPQRRAIVIWDNATSQMILRNYASDGTTILNTLALPNTASTDATYNGSAMVTAGNIKTQLNASGSAPIYACRAWVNFNGTGTVAIRASGNVTSITDNGTGNYTVNFTTAMQDANYAVNISFDSDADTVNQFSVGAAPRSAYTQQSLNTASNCRIFTGSNIAAGSTLIDFRAIHVSIFR